MRQLWPCPSWVPASLARNSSSPQAEPAHEEEQAGDADREAHEPHDAPPREGRDGRQRDGHLEDGHRDRELVMPLEALVRLLVRFDDRSLELSRAFLDLRLFLPVLVGFGVELP